MMHISGGRIIMTNDVVIYNVHDVSAEGVVALKNYVIYACERAILLQ